MYAFASLDEGNAWAESVLGVTPAYGGEHVGLGTRNSLLSLGETYLEIIAPDPTQELTGNFGERLSKLTEPGLVTWAVQGQLAEIAEALDGVGVQTVGPKRTERKTTSGDVMVWELLFPIAGELGGCMPFFIDWLDCQHPSTTNPAGGVFVSMSITSPDPVLLRNILSAISLDVEVRQGEPAIEVVIESDGGETVLTTSRETSNQSVI